MPETIITPVTSMEATRMLASSIAGKRHERLQKRADEPPFKPRRNYASNLSVCVRQMVYSHTAWNEKEPFTPEAIASMEDGKQEERLIIQELLADGFDIVEEQVQLDDDRYFLTGKLDGKIRWMGRRIPFEVKRITPYAFDKLDTWEDFKSDEFSLKKLRQLVVYLYLHNEESGLFIVSNGTGKRKEIPVPLDYDLAESILKSLDTVNAALKSGVLPDRIPYHSKICGYCPFRKTCLPDMTFGEGAVLGDEELKTAVDQYIMLKPQASAFEKLKREITSTVRERPLIIVGSHLITGEWQTRRLKSQEAKPERIERFWRWEVESKEDSHV